MRTRRGDERPLLTLSRFRTLGRNSVIGTINVASQRRQWPTSFAAPWFSVVVDTVLTYTQKVSQHVGWPIALRDRRDRFPGQTGKEKA